MIANIFHNLKRSCEYIEHLNGWVFGPIGVNQRNMFDASECFSLDHDNQGVETSASSHKASPQRSRTGTECDHIVENEG